MLKESGNCQAPIRSASNDRNDWTIMFQSERFNAIEDKYMTWFSIVKPSIGNEFFELISDMKELGADCAQSSFF